MVTVISCTSCSKSKYIYGTFFYAAFISLLSSYRFGLFKDRPYDDLLDLIAYKSQQCMSDPVVFQKFMLHVYSFIYIHISLLADVRTVAVYFQQL